MAERVLHGGHDIPRADIDRRFSRSLNNFLGDYVFLADRAVCYLNADEDPVPVFTQIGKRREVVEPEILKALEKMKRDG